MALGRRAKGQKDGSDPLGDGNRLDRLARGAAPDRRRIGVFIIGIVGFSHMAVAHNARHDYRHSMAFPCH